MLETKRLVIRNFEIEDSPSCFAGWGRDRNLGKYILGYPAEEHQMEAFVSAWAENKNAWVIVEKESQNCIGYITIDIPYMQLGIGEIGYVIGESYQHKGYAYEALNCMIQEYLFDRGLYMLEAKYNVSNTASGKRQNLVICSITKEDNL